MRKTAGVVLALGLAASAAAFGSQNCAGETAMSGMRERMSALQAQMDRIEWIQDRAERQRMMDLHMKQMQEAMRAIRKRDLGPDCRMEMMGDMMEVMIRHQHVMHEPEERH
jgi:hypothetical protein